MILKKVVVIGGGAAGMIAASTASNMGHDVILLEKNDRLGRKILITGKGRCNITNNCDIEELIENVPTNGKFLYSAFYTFTNEQVIDMFNSLGLKTKTERGKRVFPESDRAKDVVVALEKQLKQSNTKVILNAKVDKINQKNGKVESVTLSDKSTIKCDRVIIATGGVSYPRTGSTGDGYKFAKDLGHTIIKPKPSLIGLVTMEDVSSMNKLGLRNIAIKVLDKKGKKIYDEFSNVGIEGPTIRSASCRMKSLENESYKVILDLKPALDEETLDKRIQKDFKKYTNSKFEKALDDLLPQKLIPYVIKLSEIDKDTLVHQISREQRRHLVNLLKNISRIKS